MIGCLNPRQIEHPGGEKLKNKNINVILVSHNIDQAFMIGDKFFIIKNGELVGEFDKPDTSANKLRTILEK